MGEAVLAKIRWLQPSEGGRPSPPPGPRSSTVARFDTQSEEDWRKDAWSLVVYLDERPNEIYTQVARVHFLSNEAKAPLDWLSTGRRFDLFEGSKKMGEGLVL